MTSPPAAEQGTGGKLLELRQDGPVMEIGLDAGPLNLVTRPLLRNLNDAIRSISGQTGIRCVILHGGSGRAFCAGSDIGEFASLRDDASEHKILFEDMVLRALARLPMPTIAAIDGPALGGGLELALACDLRVAKAGVTVGLTESRLGGLAGSGAIRLTRLIGPGRTKEMLFTGMTLSAEQACQWGIVNRVATEGRALDLARDLASTICERGPLSNRHGKVLADAAFDMALDAGLSLSTVLQQQIFDSDDLHAGVAAFRARHPPAFEGR
jgi:enoyl-CoA hydratase